MSLLTSLISYWKLDEASGDALDASGSNTLTETGGPIASGTGKISGDRTFVRASSQYFTKADNADLSSGDIDITLQAWVKLTDTGTTGVIVCKGVDVGSNTASTFEYAIYYAGGANRFVFRVLGGGTNDLVTANTFGALATGTWYHVIGYHDSVNNVIGIAVNAGTPDTAAHSAGIQDSTGNFYLGRDGTAGQRFFNGELDEVGLWKRVLTSAERTSLYNSGAGLAYSSFGGGGGGSPVTCTPGVANLALARFAPTVSTPRTVTPPTASLSITRFAPTVSTPRTATPGTKSLGLTTFAPVVSVPRTTTPGTRSLTLTTFAPSLNQPVAVTPGTRPLTLTAFPPTISTPRTTSPGTRSLTITSFAPSVRTPRTATPGTKSLSLTGFAPVVTAGGSVTVSPGTRSLVITIYAPMVTLGGELVIITRAATLHRTDPARTFRRADAPRLFQRTDASRVFQRIPAMSAAVQHQTRTKKVSEAVLFVFDFSNFPEVIAGETLGTPTVPAVSGLTIGTPAITSVLTDCIAAGKALQVAISGGTAGVDYTVSAYVVTSGGSTRSVEGIVAVRT